VEGATDATTAAKYVCGWTAGMPSTTAGTCMDSRGGKNNSMYMCGQLGWQEQQHVYLCGQQNNSMYMGRLQNNSMYVGRQRSAENKRSTCWVA
jgi:hypothetical protein